MIDKAQKAIYRMELLNRFEADPMNPELIEWWDGLDSTQQMAVSELNKRKKEGERFQIEGMELEDERKTLVSEYLQDEPINPELFTQKRTQILPRTSISEPLEGKSVVTGLVKLNPDGSQTVVNDNKLIDLMMMPDQIPDGLSMDQAGEYVDRLVKKGNLEKEGYKLFDINSSRAIEEEVPEYKSPVLTRHKFVGQWQSFANRFQSGYNNYAITRKMFANELGMDPEERIREIAALNAEQQGIKSSQAYEEFNREKNWSGIFKKLAMNPIEIVGQGVVESLVQFLPSYVSSAAVTIPTGTAIGSAVPGVGTAAGFAGGVITAAGMASFTMEYTGKILDVMSESGIDITNPNELAQGFANPELMSKARSLGVKRGIPVAVLDMVSAGIAGRLAGNVKSKVVGGALEIGSQMGLGGSGEFAAQLATGEEHNPAAIAMEMFAEVGQAAPSGALNMAMSQNNVRKQNNFNKTDVGKEILRARETGKYETETIDMAEKLAKENTATFENKSVLQFMDETKYMTREELEAEGLDADAWFAGEGVEDESGVETVRVLGQTLEENGQVLIKLYEGARPQDVVEEFYGNHFRRLNEDDQAQFNEYYQEYKTGGGKLTKQELFEKHGLQYYFDALDTNSTFASVFQRVKELFDDVLGRATVKPEIRQMWRQAAKMKTGEGSVEGESFSVAPVFYSKATEAAKKIQPASIKARSVKNYFLNQGVKKEELNAIKLHELIKSYRPTDSIPKDEIIRWAEKNEVEIGFRGTTERSYDPDFDPYDDPDYEPEYETETRYEIYEFGESYADLGFWEEDNMGIPVSAITSEYDAQQWVNEAIDGRVEDDWSEMGSDWADHKVIERPVDGETKYFVVDSSFEEEARETTPLGIDYEGLQMPEEDDIYVSADSMDDLRENFQERRAEAYEDDIEYREFEYTNYDEPLEDGVEWDAPKWSTSVQSGGASYQETILTLPKSDDTYRHTGHWSGIDNPLVHMRFNTRDDKDGNKVLFIEEIQSDWHQEGAKRGYKKEMPDDVRDKLERLRVQYQRASEHKNGDKMALLNKEIAELEEQHLGTTPDAPFKDKAWITLAQKQILRYAVENGFDKISWTTAEQQEKRNNLATYFDSITYHKNELQLKGQFTYQIKGTDKNGSVTRSGNFTEEKLPDAVGKTVARRILNQEGEEGRTITDEDILRIRPAVDEAAVIRVEFPRTILADPYNQTVSVSPHDYHLETRNREEFVGDPAPVIYDTSSHSWLWNKDADTDNKIVREIAVRLANEELAPKGTFTLTNLNEKVVKGGLSNLYGKEMGDRFRKLTKGKIGTTELGTGPELTTHQSLELTPDIKEKFAQSQPSFSVVDIDKPIANIPRKSVFPWADMIIPISTRLAQIDPKLKTAIRDFEFEWMTKSNEDRKKASPFLTKMWNLRVSEARGGKPDVFAELDLALKNSDKETIERIVEENDMGKEYAAVRELLDDIYIRSEDSGIDMGFLHDYYPRTVSDLDGLKLTFDEETFGIIEDEIIAREKNSGPLTYEEKASLINSMILNPKKYGIKADNQKGRAISEITPDQNQYYKDSVTTLVNYIDNMNESISINKFFGKGENKLDSIGAYVSQLVEDGKLDRRQQGDVVDLLNARFNRNPNAPGVSALKNISYIMTMGSPTSAITQIGDLAWSLYNAGFYNTGKAFGQALSNRSKITREDIGIEKVGVDFSDITRTGKWLDAVFYATGLSKMDALGKETLINATINRYQNEAKSGPDTLKNELERVFGKETDQLIKDLESGVITENVKMLAFNTLLDFQPAALSEMPANYLQNKSGYTRLWYQLKTFTIKQIDVFRNQAFDKMRSDNRATQAEGLKNLIHLAIVFVAANGTADWLKDLIMGRDIHIDDILQEQLYKLAGVSRYHSKLSERRGPVEAGLRVVMPPQVSLASRMFYDYKDIKGGIFDDEKSLPEAAKNLRSVNFIPLAGKPLYWWFGGGKKRGGERELEHYTEIMKDRSLSQTEIDRYVQKLADALSEGTMTPRTYKRRLRGIK